MEGMVASTLGNFPLAPEKLEELKKEYSISHKK